MNLVLKPLPDGSFEFVDGDKKDFQILVDLQTFYTNRTTKKQLSIEETIWMVEVVSRVTNGPEQGMYTSERWKQDLTELKKFFSDRGYDNFWHQILR